LFAAGLALAEEGDGSILLDFARALMPPPGTNDNSLDTFSAVFCADGTFPRHAAVWPALVSVSELRAPTFSSNWLYSGLACSTWPAHAPDRYDGPWNRRTAAPILLVSTLADPATPYAGAVRAQQRLADARLLTLDGSGHTSLGQISTCVFEVVDAYLIDE